MDMSGFSGRRAAVAVGVLAAVVVVVVVAAAVGSRARRPAAARIVRIAAASDLRFAFDDILAALHREHPDLDVRVSYGSSGTFYAQLVNGAPFDLFMSADAEYPRQLGRRGLALPGSEFIYAIGRLVIWTPSSAAIDVTREGMNALVDAKVAHVAIADPAHAPYGRAAQAAMRHAGMYDALSSKLVLGENVAQALQFVQSGSAQAGIVALSLAAAPSLSAAGRFWEVPADWYPRLEQGGVILAHVADVDAAREVRAYLLSGAGQAILKRCGFYLPES